MMVFNSLQINFLGKNTDQLYIYRDATAYSRSPILGSSTRAVRLSTGNIAVQLIFALSVAIIIVFNLLEYLFTSDSFDRQVDHRICHCHHSSQKCRMPQIYQCKNVGGFAAFFRVYGNSFFAFYKLF